VARLADDIKMTKPFALPEEEAALSILRTADLIQQRTLEVLKPFEISGPQYNVLRILRGAREDLSCSQIAERMVNRDPDMTRLLDRMEARGLISRARDKQDRRVVKTRIAAEGMNILKRLDPLISEHHRRQFHGFGERQLNQLIDLMDQVRAASTNE
jgi:DNA-binding MarR family transcriptional regulator